MAEMIRVNIGKEPKYLPAADGKKQVVYVDVVENRRKFDNETKQWIDDDPRWYEAKFDGHDADVIRDQFQKGDSLVVFGDVERHVRETAEGRTFRTTKLFVKGFGPDPRFTRFAIDRSPRQTQSAAPAQRVDQSVDQAVDAEADQEISEFQVFRSEVQSRLSETVQQLYITHGVADVLMSQVDEPHESRELLLVNFDTLLGQLDVTGEAKDYLLSPFQAYVERHAPAPTPVFPAGPGWPGADPWTQVQQARQDVQGGLAHTPGM